MPATPVAAQPPAHADDHPHAVALRRRLEELDELYEDGVITAVELTEARRLAIAEAATEHDHTPEARPVQMPPMVAAMPVPAAAEAPAAPAQAAPPPVPPVVPPPAPPQEALPPGAQGPQGRSGGPSWLIPVVVGVAVLVLAAVIAGFLLLGGDDDGDAAPQAAAAPYPELIRPGLSQLESSSVAIGKVLARTNQPSEIGRVRTAADRQLDVVESARRRLAVLSVNAEDAPAHQQLLRAVGLQRRYLVLLGRAASPPTTRGLQVVNQARQAGAQTTEAYRRFYALAPSVPDLITGTTLADTSGLRAALVDKRAAEQQPEPAPAPAPAPPPTRYTTQSFQSPTGNLRCAAYGSTLECSSSNDGFLAVLPAYGAPSTGRGIAPGGVTVPYGSSWSNGVFSCDSAFNGITCRNATGNGFFLNRDTYTPF